MNSVCARTIELPQPLAGAIDSVCTRLGGTPAVRALVDRFYALMDEQVDDRALPGAVERAFTGMAEPMVNTGDAAPLAAGLALPKLRELPFPIALVRDADQVIQNADIRRVAGSAAVWRIEAGRVDQVVMARQPAALLALLGLPATPAAP